MKFSTAFYSLTLFWGTAAISQQQMLSSSDAVSITLENNLGIRISANQRSIDANNAGVLNSGYLPTVSAAGGGSIDRQNSVGQLANGDTRSADGAETRRYNASVSLNYVLFDGLGRMYDYKRFQEISNQSELNLKLHF